MLLPKLILPIAIWLIVNVWSLYAQVDPALCPQGPTTTRDPQWPDIPQNFEVIVELVSDDDAGELIQTFSPQRDANAVTVNGVTLREYFYFDTNEQFIIMATNVDGQTVPVCIRSVIDATSATSSVLTKTIIKPSVLLGYDARNQPNPNFGTRYVNDSTLRQIPVKVFESCFYLPDGQLTVAATYYMSDVTRFQPLGLENQSIPLRIDLRVKIGTTLGEKIIFYNVFRFLPNPKKGQERQALETPTGIFCNNRTNIRPIPADIPERFSLNSEYILPINNMTVISKYNLYDRSSQFVEVKVWLDGAQHLTELHDYSTGLAYGYESATRRCMVTDIVADNQNAIPVEGHTQFIQLANGLHVFLMDDILYQHTGSIKCRERTMCHMWIGEKPLGNGTGFEHREWYWAYEFNGQALEKWVPMKFVVYRTDSRYKRLSATEISLFNYRRDPMTVFEVDYMLSDCYHALGPAEKFYYGIFTFIIDNENQYPVHRNIVLLQRTVWQTLTDALKVRPIRFSHIVVDHNATELIVTFTLLDNPPRYGPVENPLIEPSLDTLVYSLRTLINSNSLTFPAKYNDSEVMLKAKNNSLNVIVRTPPAPHVVYETITNIFRVTETETTIRTGGSRIALFWIVPAVVGLVLGIVAGVFIRRKITS